MNFKYNFLIIVIVLITIPFTSSGQNLVPNPSFEEYDSLPCKFITHFKRLEDYIKEWRMPTRGTSDLYSEIVSSQCFSNPFSSNSDAEGFQSPRTGSNMLGIITYGHGCSILPHYREYISVKLKEPLKPETGYYAEAFISLAENSNVSANNMGFLFHEYEIYEETCFSIDYSPQILEKNIVNDTSNWVRLSGHFTADKSLNYLTIGNFRKDNETDTISRFYGKNIPWLLRSYYFIDDILVQPCISIVRDTSTCPDQEIFLKVKSEMEVKWADSLNPEKILSQQKELIASPSKTTTYLVFNDCDSQYVTVHVPQAIENEIIKCDYDSLKIDMTIPFATYLWENNSMFSKRSIIDPGKYWFQVYLPNCIHTDSFEIKNMDFPHLNLESEYKICEKEILKIDAANPNVEYLWPDNSKNSWFLIEGPGIYDLKIKSEDCSFNKKISVEKSICKVKLTMPNIFTPNDDGINDRFIPILKKGIVESNLRIFNRWGNKIYETKNLEAGWNGLSENNSLSSTGIYWWSVTYLDINGEKSIINGIVHLLY